MTKQRLLTPQEAEDYRLVVESYHPSGQVVYNFARSNFAVIAGPTGAGKDTIRNAVQEDPAFISILSTTSRPVREGEQDGIEYHFRPLEFFDKGLDEKRFLQVALVHNQQLSALDFSDIQSLASGQIGIGILVVQTEIALRKLNSNIKTVFIVPPTLDTLKQRVQNERILDSAELDRRMQATKNELLIAQNETSYFCVVNDDINRACEIVANYFKTSEKVTGEDKNARDIIKQILKELE